MNTIENVLFWNGMFLSVSEIACKVGISEKDVARICENEGVKTLSLKDRVFGLVWLEKKTDEEVVKEISLFLKTFTLSDAVAIRKESNLSEAKNPSWSIDTFCPYSYPDPSH